MNEQRNLILAIGLSILIIVGFQLMMPPPPPVDEAAPPVVDTPTATVPGVAPVDLGAPTAAVPVPVAPVAEDAPRVQIDTPSLSGSITMRGAKLDDLVLKNYGETTDPDSDRIVFLKPAGVGEGYHVHHGWHARQPGLELPGPDALWVAEAGAVLTPSTPVTLRWSNGSGLSVTRTLAIDEDYLITVTDEVRNTSGAPLSLYPYGLVSRTGTPLTDMLYILHEGALGVVNGTLEEFGYDDLREDGTQQFRTTGGWAGITDKYWLAALLFDQQASGVQVNMGSSMTADRFPRYQVDYVMPAVTVPAGGSVTQVSHVFAGAKELSLIEAYEAELGITSFDLAIDFGWFYFLTKPLAQLLQWLNSHIGNMGLAIIAITVLIRLAMYWLADKSYRNIAKMKDLQPKVVKLQEQFGDDKQRLQQEILKLYRESKTNPLAGCLPILVQIPIFFALYKVLYVTIEMRHAPFFGWIQDLSAPDPTSVFNLFGLLPFTPPSFLMIGVWPLLMGFSMWFQQKLNPTPPDPVQAKIFAFLPIVFTFLLANFAAGLVIYWTFNNMLSIAQQRFIMWRMGVKA